MELCQLACFSRTAMATQHGGSRHRSFVSARVVLDRERSSRGRSGRPLLLEPPCSGTQPWRVPPNVSALSDSSIPNGQPDQPSTSSSEQVPDSRSAAAILAAAGALSPTLPVGGMLQPEYGTNDQPRYSVDELLGQLIAQQQSTNRILLETAQANKEAAHAHIQLQSVTAQATYTTATSAPAAQVPSGHPASDGAQPDNIQKRSWDPAVRAIFEKFHREIKKRTETLKTHLELQAKYNQPDFIHKQFAQETKSSWQLPRAYCQIATPVADVEDEDPDYDIERSYLEMRRRHAQKCWTWVKTHQQRCTEFMQEQLSEHVLTGILDDELAEWALSHHPDEQSMAFHKNEARTIIRRWLRIELPAMHSRMKKEQDKRDKRQQNLLEAEVRYRTADNGTLIAQACLELQNSQKSRGKHIVSSTGVFKHLLQDTDDDSKKKIPLIFQGESTPANRSRKPGKGKRKGKGGRSRSPSNTPRKTSTTPRPTPRSILKPRSQSTSRVRFQIPQSPSGANKGGKGQDQRQSKGGGGRSPGRKGKSKGKGKNGRGKNGRGKASKN